MSMCGAIRKLIGTGALLATAGVHAGHAQEALAPSAAVVPGILPSAFGATVDRDIAASRTATSRFRDAAEAVRAGYPAATACVEHQPHGVMGLHYMHPGLQDLTLDVERPEVLVYERLEDGTLRLNGVEYLVPITAWTRAEPPRIMGQDLKRSDALGIWYLHVWNWTANPSGVFADWNPDLKCRG